MSRKWKKNTDWEEAIANDIFDEGLVPRIYKELPDLDNKMKNSPIHMSKRLPKNTYNGK